MKRLLLVFVVLAGLVVLQQRLARRSTRGVWRVVPDSDHLIAGSQPHAVAAAVSEMLDLVARR